MNRQQLIDDRWVVRYNTGMTNATTNQPDLLTEVMANLNEITRQLLIAVAEQELAEDYPQYQGHWDTWSLGRVVHTIRDKWGDVMAEPGTLLLVKPFSAVTMTLDVDLITDTVYLDSHHHWAGRMRRSLGGGKPRGCNTTVTLGYVEVIAEARP